MGVGDLLPGVTIPTDPDEAAATAQGFRDTLGLAEGIDAGEFLSALPEATRAELEELGGEGGLAGGAAQAAALGFGLIGGDTGSILGGGARGAALGAAAGSVFPGIGTGIGAGIGAIAGLAGALFGGGPGSAKAEDDELARVTPEEALDHPTWDMGPRITVDSATLMNKGFELIESRWLFGLPPDRIDVVIHPQSIVHSLVELVDGSLLAHAGPTDMRVPIQDALTYPERWEPSAPRLDLAGSSPWTFLPADGQPALMLARRALDVGGVAPAVLNAADEVAVEAFLDGGLRFDRITGLVEAVLDEAPRAGADSIEAVRTADSGARKLARARL